MAAASTVMIAGGRGRRLMAERARSRMMRHRVRRAIGTTMNSAFRLGSALKSGTVAFADSLTQKGSWGRT